MATYYSNTNRGYRLRLDVTQTSQNTGANTSDISYTLYLESTTASFGQWGHTRSLSINGTQVYNVNNQITIGTHSTLTLDTGTRTIAHNSDGTKSISLVASFDANQRSGWVVTSALTINTSMTLTTIPRASQPTLNISTQALGSSITISTNRASTSFTHILRYRMGGYSDEPTTGVGVSHTWTLPNYFAHAIPNATSGVGTITCETYNGSTLIGTKTVNFTATVPNNSTFQPTATINSIVQGTTLPSGITAFVQNKSKVRVTSSGTGKSSSTIKTYSVAVANIGTYTGSDITSDFLKNSGSVRVTLTVTDSRGLKGSTYQDITVVAYSPPQIPTFNAQRSESTPTNIVINYNASISSVSNQNGVVYRIRSLATGGSWVVNKTVTTGYSFSGTETITSDSDKSYTIEIYVADKWTAITQTVQVGTAFTLIDFNNSGKGMAIGKVSESDSFEVALPTALTGGVQSLGTTNLDTTFTSGLYYYTTATQGTPTSYGVVQTMVSSGATYNGSNNWLFQLAFDTNGDIHNRVKINAGAFTSWATLWTARNSNSMTGSGSNGNGRYIQFSDGTQICYHSVTATYNTNRILDTAWTYPASFVASPTLIATPPASINSDIDYETIARASAGVSYSTVRVTAGGTLRFASGNTRVIYVIAIGRWK